MILSHIIAPERLHGEDLLPNQFAPMLHIDPVILHLLVIPAESDAENETAGGDDVEGGQLFCEGDVIVLRRQADPGSQLDAIGHGGRSRQGDVGVRRAAVFLGEHRFASGGRRAPTRGDMRVLGNIERVKPSIFGFLGQFDRADACVRSVNRDPDLHG